MGLEKTSKESIPEIVKWLTAHENATPLDAIKELGLEMLSEEEVRSLIDKYVNMNVELIAKRGEKAFGSLMGMIMKDLRGRVKPKLVNKILREKLTEKLKSKTA